MFSINKFCKLLNSCDGDECVLHTVALEQVLQNLHGTHGINIVVY